MNAPESGGPCHRGRLTDTPLAAPAHADLVSTFTEDGYVFLRYRHTRKGAQQ